MDPAGSEYGAVFGTTEHPYVGKKPGKSIQYLQEKMEELEEIRDAKIAEYEAIMQRGAGGKDGKDNIDPEEERQVAKRNAFLRRELARMQLAERRHALDPRVLEKKNLTASVWQEIQKVEEEIATLRKMKKRRDKSLRAIEWGEENARRVRSENAEVSAQLRLTLKELKQELREVNRRDMEAHERCARLQDIIKLGATEDEVEELKKTIDAQRLEIEHLRYREAQWRKVKDGVHSELKRKAASEKKQIKKLTQELNKLHAILTEKAGDARASEEEANAALIKAMMS